MNIKIEHTTELNLRTGIQREIVKVGEFRGPTMKQIDFNFLVINGKVKSI